MLCSNPFDLDSFLSNNDLMRSALHDRKEYVPGHVRDKVLLLDLRSKIIFSKKLVLSEQLLCCVLVLFEKGLLMANKNLCFIH